MKKILFDTYKSIYFIFISILWTFVILFAIVQNGVFTGLIVDIATRDSGIHIDRVDGGIFGVMRIEGVKFKDALSAKTINVKINLFALLEKKLKIDMLDIKSIAFDAQKLSEELSKQNDKNDFDEVIIKAVRLQFAEHNSSGFVTKFADFKISNLSYVSKRLLFEYSLEAKTNIINVKADGHYKDMNYTSRGVMSASGDQYINTLANDVDFDFNAFKKLEFTLHGDNKSLSAEGRMVDSGVFYKYNVDSKIVDVETKLFCDLTKNSFVTESKGLVCTKYGVIDSEFKISYSDTVKYKGSGFVHHFDYIPLGVFRDDLKIQSASNQSLTFEGDIHKLLVNIGETTVNGTLLDRQINIVSPQSFVEYDFDKEDLKVGVVASGHSKFGDFDVNTTVKQDSSSFVSFDGKVVCKNGKNEFFKSALVDSARATFVGDEKKLRVGVASNRCSVDVVTDDYDSYRAKISIAKAKLDEILDLPSRYSGISFGVSGDVAYTHKTKTTKLDVDLKDTKIFGQNSAISKISAKKSPNSFVVEPCNFEIGQLKGTLGSSNVSDNLFYLRANGISVDSRGNLNEPSKVAVNLDFDKSAGWLNEIFEVRKNTFGGKLKIDASVKDFLSSPEVQVSVVSDSVKLFDFDFKNLDLSGDYRNSLLKVQNFALDSKLQHYKLTKTPKIVFTDDGFVIEKFAINNTLFAKGEYKNSEFRADVELRNYLFFDDKLAKMNLNGAGWLVRQNGKNYINGEVVADATELYYYPKSVKITKDKSIKVINKKAPPKIEEEFINNSQINVRFTHKGIIQYKTKDSFASLSADLVYYKDFEQKPNFVGPIKLLNGYYLFQGRKFNIVNGDIVLLNGENENPYVDLTLKLDESDITIYVGAKGLASTPKLSFWSTPALGEREIMSYLVFGIDDEFGFGKSGVKSDYTAKAIGALSNTLSRDVAGELGIKLDKIEVSPSEYQRDGKTVGAAKVEIGKKVTKNLTVIYKNDVESGVALQYRINKNVGIETESRTRGNSIDVYYKKDY